MSDASPDIAAIDASLTEGGWWLLVLQDLIRIAMTMARDLKRIATSDDARPTVRCVDIVREFARVAGAVHRAIALSQRLDGALAGLRALRLRAPEDIAAARAKAMAEAEGRDSARARARDAARARREARDDETAEPLDTAPDREAAAAERPEVLPRALHCHVRPDAAYIDLEPLRLRETIEKICADLRIIPPWSRWEAGDWLPPDPEIEGADPPSGAPPAPRLERGPPRCPPGAYPPQTDPAVIERPPRQRPAVRG